MATKKKKAAPKKSTKKSIASVVTVSELKCGDVFTATYNRKQIQGEVLEDYKNVFDSQSTYLLGTHKGGETVNTTDGRGWTTQFEINKSNEEPLAEELKELGITNLQIIKDRKQREAILATRLPDDIGGYEITVEDGKVSFGCGQVQVTKKEIQDFLVFRKKAEAFFNSAPGKLYKRVDHFMKDNDTDSSVMDIDEKDIQKILAIL